MLAAMAVPAAAASGHTKRSGRLAGAKLSSRRSPQRGADALRKCRWGSCSQHLCSLSRRGSSLPARRRCYSLTPGHLGRLRSARLLPERARFLPDRSEVPAPSVLTECQQTSCNANRWEGFALPASGFASFRNTFGRSGEQGPALGSGRRARPHRSATSGRNSAPFAQPLPRARLFPLQLDPAPEGGGEPELTLCTESQQLHDSGVERRARALTLLEVICKLLCLLFAYLV